jgi:hypothetical protein
MPQLIPQGDVKGSFDDASVGLQSNVTRTGFTLIASTKYHLAAIPFSLLNGSTN